jgi:hypothetical protein
MKLSPIMLSLASVGLSSQALAAGAEVDIGAEYQVNLTHSDDGLRKPDEEKRTELNLKGAKISLKGKLSDQISWSVLYKAKESELERYWLTNKVSDNLEVSVGKQKIKVYGLHRRLASSTTSPITGAYLSANPLTDKMAIDVTYKALGSFSLQLVEDYTSCKDSTSSKADLTTGNVTTTTSSTCTSWNSSVQKQPAVAFDWLGSFADLQPLVQYAVYDLGKSSTASFGLRFKNDSLDAYVDFTQDVRGAKGTDAEGKTENQKTTYTGAVVYAEYKLGDYSPFFHYSSFNTDPYVKEGTSEAAKVKAESNSAGKLDKVESTLAIGTHLNHWGTFYRPFFDVVLASGRYVDQDDTTKDKVLTRTDLVAGVIGKF